jgi:uncharacterized membrane protein
METRWRRWASLLKLSHVVLAMTIVAGTLGSSLLNRRASRSDDVELIWQLTRAAALFDRMQTVSGPLLVLSGLATAWAQGLPLLGLGEGWILASVLLIILLIVLVVTVFVPAGARVERAILASRAEERVTDELRGAWRGSPPERLAFWYGQLVSPAIIALMVIKPL